MGSYTLAWGGQEAAGRVHAGAGAARRAGHGEGRARGGSARGVPRRPTPRGGGAELMGILEDGGRVRGSHVMVDFFADWCGPRHRVAPAFRELSQRFAQGDTRHRGRRGGQHGQQAPLPRGVPRSRATQLLPPFEGTTKLRRWSGGRPPEGLEDARPAGALRGVRARVGPVLRRPALGRGRPLRRVLLRRGVPRRGPHPDHVRAERAAGPGPAQVPHRARPADLA